MELMKEKWVNSINTVTIGQTKENGGTRSSVITIGGEGTLPFLTAEGPMPYKPKVAMEVLDVMPEDWPEPLMKHFRAVAGDTVKWAVKCVEDFGAEAICVNLEGTHPDFANKSDDETAAMLKDLKAAVKVPLVIFGSGVSDKDNLVLPKAAEVLKGENCLIGDAIDKNYKTLTAACIAYGHSIIAESPIDINIAKQVNIMINDMGFPLNRIVMNPTIGSLGYGIEYAYSIMERARLAALGGDKLLAMPFICFAGQEAWKCKEAKAEVSEHPEWGDLDSRGTLWEILTAVLVLQSGGDLVVMRHPDAAAKVKRYIDSFFSKSEAGCLS